MPEAPYLHRVVIDTNTVVSGLLLPDSIPGRVIRQAAEYSTLLMSEPTVDELAKVLSRSKFDRYVNPEKRQAFLLNFISIAEMVPVLHEIKACRDPRDDKFLELAVSGSANLLLTGDRDLLALHPFRSIPIFTPSDWLAGQL